jgi:protocatechuate 3,4-dioxygenase beta subunit
MKIFLIFIHIFFIFSHKLSFAQTPNNSYYINKKTDPNIAINEIMQYPQEPKVRDYNDLEMLKKVEESTLEKKLSPFSPNPPTPSRLFTADLSMPDNFATTNNLAKKAGSFYRAYGEIIFIQGTVSDSFGIPIHNAVIEIWQTNSAGKYHTLLESGSGYVDKFFNMSGRAITDNIGNYHFITIMPGASAGRAPHINMNVYHPRFGRLETEMYFMNHPYNFSDFQYLSYTEEERILLTANVRTTDILNPKSIKIATFNITLKGIHQYKKL